jgi:DNA/RNA-binding protein KIN17
MGKEGGFLTPKAISNRIKSKGLQKLRWYCQMCQKQCRDENGMRCHMASEGHLRMMKVFAENSGKIISNYSEQFLSGFLKTLSHRHGSKRVLANKVYQEYIGDKDHIHMNSTAWSSLAGLCKHLGREGRCVVDETEKGWYIQYIDRDPKTLEKQALLDERQKAELDDEQRSRMLIEAQIAAGASGEGDEDEAADEEEDAEDHMLERSSDEPKIEIKLSGMQGERQRLASTANLKRVSFVHEEEGETDPIAPLVKPSLASKLPVIEQIRAEEERRKLRELEALDKHERKDYWLQEGLVVKIINKKIGEGRYFKAKGVVVAVIERYAAEVQVEGMALLRLDQDDLETVIPQPGHDVVIVNGRCRGAGAVVVAINEASFSCDIRISSGSFSGRDLKAVVYEDICKFADGKQ